MVLDGVYGWEIASQVSPETLEEKILSSPDERFVNAARLPGANGVTHFLVPNPERTPGDYLVELHPGLYEGEKAGFELVEEFPRTPEQWRLYRVEPLTSGHPEDILEKEPGARVGGVVGGALDGVPEE